MGVRKRVSVLWWGDVVEGVICGCCCGLRKQEEKSSGPDIVAVVVSVWFG